MTILALVAILVGQGIFQVAGDTAQGVRPDFQRQSSITSARGAQQRGSPLGSAGPLKLGGGADSTVVKENSPATGSAVDTPSGVPSRGVGLSAFVTLVVGGLLIAVIAIIAGIILFASQDREAKERPS